LNRVLGKLLLIVTLCGVLLTGCADETQTKPAVTLIVKTPTLAMNVVNDPDMDTTEQFLESASAAFAAQYDKADVTIDVQTFDLTHEQDAISAAFDTSDAPDVLFEDFFNMSSYIHTGRVVPLDDIITDDIRGDIADSAWQLASVDGKTYMMPLLSRQNVLIYDKSYMRDCGLDAYLTDEQTIQTWSIDQWTEILDTLAAGLPENVYPMMMYAKNNQGDTHILTMLRAFGASVFDDEGNFDFQDPACVKALAWIQDGVDRGWYPPHPENLEITDTQELAASGQLVFQVFNLANLSLFPDIENYGFVNFPGGGATSFQTGFEVFDNGDPDKVAVAKDFIQYIFQTDEWLEKSAGTIPESLHVAEKYADQIFMLDAFTENAANVIDFMHNSPNWQGSDDSVRSVFWTHIHDLLLGTVSPEQCAADLDRDCNAALAAGRQNSVLHE
jgi:multiple sugar transport system substrate-binding protein